MSIKDFTKVAIISLLFILIFPAQITWAAVQETFTIYYPSKASDIQRVSCAEGAQYVFQVSGAPGNAIYEWHFSGGNWSGAGSSVTFTPTARGTYTVTVKVSIPGPGPGEPWIFTGTRAIDLPTIVFSLYDGRDKGYVCKDDPSPETFRLKATVTHDEVSKALKGVEVTFTVKPNKGSFSGNNPDTTNSSGIADQCFYTPDVTTVGEYTLYAESNSPAKSGPIIYIFTVDLTRKPIDIAAETAWTGINDKLQRSIITVTINPKEAEVQLIDDIILGIKEVTGGEGYEPGEGTLVQDSQDKTKWIYTSFTEPKTEKHPKTKFLKIIAKYNKEECSNVISINVDTVFNYLITARGYGNYTNALRYVEWKYDFGGPTGIYAPGLEEYGSTLVYGLTFYGPAAFASENLLASTIGHEGVHRAQGFLVRWKAIMSKRRYDNGKGNGYNWAVAERPAWGWELDNVERTGLEDEEELRLIRNQINFFQGIIDQYPGGEGPP